MFLLDLLKQDVGTLLFLVYLLKVPNVGYDMVSRAMSEQCRNLFLLFWLKQDVRTLMLLLCLLKVHNLGYDMWSRGMSEQRWNACVFAIFAQAGCRNPNVFAVLAQSDSNCGGRRRLDVGKPCGQAGSER